MPINDELYQFYKDQGCMKNTNDIPFDDVYELDQEHNDCDFNFEAKDEEYNEHDFDFECDDSDDCNYGK